MRTLRAAAVQFEHVPSDKAANLAAKYPDIATKVVAFQDTERIPNDGVQYVKTLDPKLQAFITEALLAISKDPGGKAMLASLYTINAFEKMAALVRALDEGLISGVGFVLVMVYMAVFYGLFGWMANVALMANLVFVLFGVVAYNRIGVDRFPRIEFPVISVTTVLPGANPDVVDASVTNISTSGLYVGMLVASPFVPANTTISAISPEIRNALRKSAYLSR